MCPKAKPGIWKPGRWKGALPMGPVHGLPLIKEALAPDPRFEEKIAEDRLRWRGKIFESRTLSVQLPDGSSGYREVVRYHGGAGVVALDDDGRICLVRQYRVALGRMTLEIPAGKLEAGETGVSCAARELSEETGLLANRLEPLVRVLGSPGFTDEHTEVFLARDLRQGDASPDEGELVSSIWVPLESVVEAALQGLIQDGKTVSGVLAANALLASGR